MLYETTQNYYRTEEGALVAEFMESAFSKVEQQGNKASLEDIRAILTECVETELPKIREQNKQLGIDGTSPVSAKS